MTHTKDYYAVLGIRPAASAMEIELAFKGRRTQYHPDKYAQADDETVRWATRQMQAIVEAHDVLSDAVRRQRYDAMREASHDRDEARATQGGGRHRDVNRDVLLERVALVAAQLRADLDATEATLLEGDGEEDQDEHDVLELMLSPLRECSSSVSKMLKRLPFVAAAADTQEAVVRAQMLVAILSTYSLSVTPKDFINGMGRDVYFGIQGIHADHLERSLESHEDDASDFYRQLTETNDLDDFLQVLQLLGAPDHEDLGIGVERGEFLRKILGHELFTLPFSQAMSLSAECHAINADWVRQATALAETGISREMTRGASQASARARDRDANILRQPAASSGNREPSIADYLVELDLEQADAERFHLAPHIPQKKLAKAIVARGISSAAPPEAVHLLIDDTVFKGGAEGLLITDAYMSFKSLFMESVDYHYAGPGGWNGGFEARKCKIFRFDSLCVDFTQISAAATQQLVWTLNRFLADRLQWHLAQAKGGDVASQFFVSGSLSDDQEQALYWLTEAAENGHATAQHNLGVHYLSADAARARKWLGLAAEQGHRLARQRLDSIR
ncbi:DnaJ domain-containing protein [Achromobacter aloeverae]